MQTSVGYFADSVEAIDICTSLVIYHHTTAGEVGGWYDRDWLLGNVDTNL